MFDRIYRVSSRFELIRLERLSASERSAVESLEADANLYGVLRPRGTGALKAIGTEIALLLHSLQEAGPLPRYLTTSQAGPDLERQVLALLQDGVIEVLVGDEFVSGDRVLEFVPSVLNSDSEGFDRSEEALRYAELLEIEDAELVAERLYAYGRLPLSTRWGRALPDVRAILKFVGGLAKNPWRHLGPNTSRGWVVWSRIKPREVSAPKPSPAFKLYLSPTPEDLPRVFDALPEPLNRGHSVQVKLASTAMSLMRPDKLVAYFESEEDLLAAARLLDERLSGVSVQGVPFTAEVGAGGALSWGMDPPPQNQLISWRSRNSWRTWIVDRLATALVDAQEREPGRSVWQGTLHRLSLEGIDTVSWTPNRRLWTQPNVGGRGA